MHVATEYSLRAIRIEIRLPGSLSITFVAGFTVAPRTCVRALRLNAIDSFVCIRRSRYILPAGVRARRRPIKNYAPRVIDNVIITVFDTTTVRNRVSRLTFAIHGRYRVRDGISRTIIYLYKPVRLLARGNKYCYCYRHHNDDFPGCKRRITAIIYDLHAVADVHAATLWRCRVLRDRMCRSDNNGGQTLCAALTTGVSGGNDVGGKDTRAIPHGEA